MKVDPGDASLWGVLDRFGVLSHVPPSSQARLIGAGRRVKLSAGQPAGREGEAPPGLSCVVRGRLRFSSVDEAGREFVFHIGFPGVWFGQAMFDKSPAVVSATAMVDSEIFVLSADNVWALFNSDVHVALFVVRSLTWVGRVAIQRLKERLTLPNAAVVACLLHQQACEATHHAGDIVDLSLPQVEVAAMCGLSAKTVARVLHDFERKGLIALGYGSTRILDMTALERIALDPLLGPESREEA